jgi:hypothetical protein
VALPENPLPLKLAYYILLAEKVHPEQRDDTWNGSKDIFR